MMASYGEPASAEIAPSTAAAGTISFSISKKNQQGPSSASGAVKKRENPAAFVRGHTHNDESEMDLVFSLEGGSIHR